MTMEESEEIQETQHRQNLEREVQKDDTRVVKFESVIQAEIKKCLYYFEPKSTHFANKFNLF